MEPLSSADKPKGGQVHKTTKKAVSIYIFSFSFTAGNGYWGEYKPASVSRCRLAAANFAFRLAPVLVCRMPLLTALSISWYASDISFSTGLMASSDDGRSVMKLSTAVITYMYRHQAVNKSRHPMIFIAMQPAKNIHHGTTHGGHGGVNEPKPHKNRQVLCFCKFASLMQHSHLLHSCSNS